MNSLSILGLICILSFISSITAKEFKHNLGNDRVFLTTALSYRDIADYEIKDNLGDGVCTKIVQTDLIKITPNIANRELRYDYAYYYDAHVAVSECCDGWIQIDDFCVQQCTEADIDCTEFVPDSSYCKNLRGDGVCVEIVQTELIKNTSFIVDNTIWYDYSSYFANVTECKCCDGWVQIDNFCVKQCTEDDTDCTEFVPDSSYCENLRGDGVCAEIVETELIKTTAAVSNGEIWYDYSSYFANVTECKCCDGWVQIDNFCVQQCTKDDSDCIEFVPDSSHCENLRGDGVCAEIVETELIKSTAAVSNGEIWYDYSSYFANVTECKCCDGWVQIDNFCIKQCTEDDIDCTEFVPDSSYCVNLRGDGICAEIVETELIKTTAAVSNGEIWYDYSSYFANVTECKCCDGWVQIDNFCVQQCTKDDSDCTEFVPDSSYCENLQGDGVCAEIVQTDLIKTTASLANDKIWYDYSYYLANVTECKCCDGWVQVDNFCVQHCTEDVPDCIDYVPDPIHCEHPHGDGVCAEVVEKRLIKTSPYIVNGEIVYRSVYYNGNITVCECCDGWMQVDNFCVQQCTKDDANCTASLPDPSYCHSPLGDGVCTEIVEKKLIKTTPYLLNGEVKYRASYYRLNSTVCKCCDGWMQVDDFCVQQCTENNTNCTEYVPNPSYCKYPQGEGVCSEIVELTLVRNISYDPFVYQVEPYQANVTMCSCCEGWLQNGSSCVPHCSSSCINAKCTLPDTCTCYDGYKPDDEYDFMCHKDCSSEGCSCENGYVLDEEKKICKPVCSRECTNGICGGPEKCHCDIGYKLNSVNSYMCEPICSESCRICLAPNTCGCNDGYILDKDGYTCNPICDPECIHGECAAPNNCECNYGYTSDNVTWNNCIPICEICVYGDCVGPWECECWNSKPANRNGTCSPYCPEGCPKGAYCVDSGICKCQDYYYLDESGQCISVTSPIPPGSSAKPVERTTKIVLFSMILLINLLATI